MLALAQESIDRCRLIAGDSEEPGYTTRTFLSQPMHAVHERLRTWMQRAGMTVTIDPDVTPLPGLKPILPTCRSE